MKEKIFDQFYTNPIVSNAILEKIKDIIEEYFPLDRIWIEPSAGTGNFIGSIQSIFSKKEIINAYDIDPQSTTFKIQKEDFLKLNIESYKNKNTIVVGNPPFGKRGKLALEFLNKSLSFSNLVIMILPIQFDKWLLQKNVDSNAKLIKRELMVEESFIHLDQPYSVRTAFYVWSKIVDNKRNLRLKKAPKLSHPDFEAYIHNNTINTQKYFSQKKYKWKFAIFRQGYYDYSKKITSEKEARKYKNRQFIFIKPNNKRAEIILNKISYINLSKLNTSTPGFGKADLVREYEKVLSGENAI